MQSSPIPRPGYEAVHLFEDPARGARILIALHSTRLGPALGGCRALHYASDEEALTDVCRLAEGMTRKNALAGLDFGGGKAVLLLPEGADAPDEAMLEALGEAVEALGGSYIVTEDMGMSTQALEVLRARTAHVCGTLGGEFSAGHPGPYTAHGLHCAMRVIAEMLYPESAGGDDPDAALMGLDVVVSGLGSVGEALARSLAKAGCALRLADIRADHAAALARELDAEAVPADEAQFLETDVFSPNARGACFDDETIPRMQALAVTGAANNQLAEPRHGQVLHRVGILYAPDYLVNAGGVLGVAPEAAKRRTTPQERMAAAEGVAATLRRALVRAKERDCPPEEVAEQMVAERLGTA